MGVAGQDAIVGTQGTAESIENERRRQEVAADTDFLRMGVYFFELVIPSKALTPSPPGSTTSILYPLILNPEMILEESRFDVSKTRLNLGGMTVEESGISERMLIIRGHTGFKPRSHKVQAQTGAGKTLAIANPHFHMREHPSMYVGLSGQKHFQILQDRIFNTYGELKKTREFAKDTILNFHNPKDGKHWRIIPEVFRETRVTNRKFLYQYEIIASIVDVAEPVTLKAGLPEEDTFFTQLKNAIDKGKREIDKVNAEIENIQAFITEVQDIIQDIGSVFSKLTQFVNNITAVIESIENGIVSVGTVPLQSLLEIAQSVDQMAEAAINLPSNIRDAYAANLRRISDGILSLGLVKELFQPSPPAELAELNSQLQGLTGESLASLEAATPASSISGYARGSGGVDASDLTRISNTPAALKIQAYRSVKTVRLQRGDTVGTLAARYLGNVRRWREIAILNSLEAPYTSEAGLPKTLRIGDVVKIPSVEPPRVIDRPAEIIGGPIDDSQDVRTYGRDFMLKLEDGMYDLQIDQTSGKTDFSVVAGIDNMAQGIAVRVDTEAGTDPLFPDLGLARIIAMRLPAIDVQMFRVRLIQAIKEDPRVMQISQVRFLPGEADTIETEIDVIPVSSDTPMTVNLSTPISESLILG